MEAPKSIDDFHKNLRDKAYSTVELVDYYLGRINTFDKKLNSFITVTSEYAYKKAKEIDHLISDNPDAFEELPLLGVIVSVKDMFLTKGIRTTAASKLLDNYIPQYSATAVERLEKAGAIIIGKVNC